MTTSHENPASQIDANRFRVTIFGSARIQKDDRNYQQIFELAKKIGENGIDLITGGGPGIMEAANAGHGAGDLTNTSNSIGLNIVLPHEQTFNKHLDIKIEFNNFSERLLSFMKYSNVIIVAPGGIGTCLELFFAWQLTQVGHVPKMPIILLNDMWTDLLKWIKSDVLANGYMSESDLDNIYVAENNKQALDIILHEYGVCVVDGKNRCEHENIDSLCIKNIH